MKRILQLIGAISLLSAINPQLNTIFAQGTAFTYQGELNNNGAPAGGSYDIAFSLFPAGVGGAMLIGPVTNPAVAVSNGLFTTTVDFGNVFTGASNWLQIAVSTNGANSFTTLTPRQQLTPVPYAINAASAGSVSAANISGIISSAQLPASVVTNGAGGVNISGTFSGNGAGVTNVNLYALNSQGAIAFTTNYGNFTPASSPGVGTGASSIVAADVNGDGKMDLICANENDNTLSVLTNDGSGGFTLLGPLVPANSPSSVIAMNVNSDSKLDLICANYLPNTLTVLTNRGGGRFTVAATLNVGGNPYAVVAADINNDGKMDLISANSGGNTLSVFTNNGSGVFGSNATINVGNVPYSVIAADVNNDGKMDLICANAGSKTLSVFTNDGSGGFMLASSLGTSGSPYSVASADIDNDGRMDLICVNIGPNTLTVFTNNGGGTFGTNATLNVDFAPVSVLAADVNNDGWVDLISANKNSSTLTVFTNNGSGGFVHASSPGVGSGPTSVIAADVNNDGQLDLITANGFGSTVSVLLNTPVSFGPPAAFTGSFTGNSSGTFSGDGGSLTNLSAAQLSGTIPLAQLSGITGSQLNAAAWQLATNLNGGNAALSTNVVSGLSITNAFITNSIFAGNGGGLTNLTASQLSSGTVPLAQLAGITGSQLSTATWQLATNLNGGNAALATNLVSGLSITNAFITNSTFAGNGGGLTNLSASQLSSGTIPLAQLSGITGSQLNAAAWQLATNLNGGNAALATNVVSGLNLTNAFITNSTFAGNGAGLTNLNASQLASGVVPQGVLPGFQSPGYIAIGGGQNNSASGQWATIGGGDSNTNTANAGTIAGGQNNLVFGGYQPAVGGGYGNQAGTNYATVAGGNQNSANGPGSTIAGGFQNSAVGTSSTIAGGQSNFAQDANQTIGGGIQNSILGLATSSTIGGGNSDTILSNAFNSVISGGASNTNGASRGVIAGGRGNQIQLGALYGVVGGGNANNVTGQFGVIAGGQNNIATNFAFAAGQNAQATNPGAFVWADSQAGAFGSATNDSFNVRARGGVNLVTSGAGITVDGSPLLSSGGGSGISIQQNTNGAPVIIAGSPGNFVAPGVVGATIAGGGVTNYNGTGISYTNSVTNSYGTVSGGYGNTSGGSMATVAGGARNSADGYQSTVSGGYADLAGGSGAVISGGALNTASGDFSGVAAGQQNKATAAGAFVGGGGSDAGMSQGGGNTASGVASTVAGGDFDTAGGDYSAVPGGYLNIANGDYSFAAGQNARALHQGAFVWADSQNAGFSPNASAVFASTANDQFLIRAQGGVGIGTNAPAAQLQVTSSGGQSSPQLRLDQTTAGDYARLRLVSGASGGVWDIAAGGSSPHVLNFFVSPTPGAAGTNILALQANGNASLWGTLAQGSDRAHKENLKDIDPQTVLAKVATLPITEWNYITDAGVLHLGPMAQDFYAAFNLGADDKHITTIDEGGVALAAIQGLNQKLEQTRVENEELRRQNDALARRLNDLEQTVQSLAQKK